MYDITLDLNGSALDCALSTQPLRVVDSSSYTWLVQKRDGVKIEISRLILNRLHGLGRVSLVKFLSSQFGYLTILISKKTSRTFTKS